MLALVFALSAVGPAADATGTTSPGSAQGALANSDSDTDADAGDGVFQIWGTSGRTADRRGNSDRRNALSPEEIFASNVPYLETFGCAGQHLATGQCEVPVACGGGTTEVLRAAEVVAGQRPESQCTPTPPVVTDAAILQAFREVPLPQATLTIQPPDGTTLVNLDTNFYTHAEPFTTTVTVLDHTVTLDIHPTSYTWNFGDGTTTTTTTPGAPYPDLQVTHAYTQPGTVTTQVTTTWSADYQIDDGPWNTVDGTVTMTSPTVPLTIREATPVLVD